MSKWYKQLIFDDLGSLIFDENTILENSVKNSKWESKIKVDDQILAEFFNVKNIKTGKSYYTRKMDAIDWARKNGCALIMDGRKYYIDVYNSYVDKKKKNILINYRYNISRFQNKLFYANRNPTNNRLDHNITSMSKSIVEIIKESNDLVEIDMKNAQFALHAFLMKKEGLCKEEVCIEYYNLCAKGTLYESVGKLLGKDRNQAKVVMMELAFSSNKYNTSNKKLFKSRFPNVFAHINQFKKLRGNSKLFAIELQKMESEIFVDNLYPAIKDLNLFCLTKHDSLIIKRKNEMQVVELMKSYFKHLGFECVLDIEGRHVPVCSDGTATQNKGIDIMGTQIQDQTKIVETFISLSQICPKTRI